MSCDDFNSTIVVAAPVFSSITVSVVPLLVIIAICGIMGCDQPPTDESKRGGYSILTYIVCLILCVILFPIVSPKLCEENSILAWISLVVTCLLTFLPLMPLIYANIH